MIISDIETPLHSQALAVLQSSSAFNDENLTMVNVGNIRIAPWGEDNIEPKRVLDLIRESDVMSSNLSFNINVCYGLGPRLVKITKDSSGKEFKEIVTQGKEYDFFTRNDIPMFFLETLTDMNFYHNSFAEIIFDKDYKEIYSLRCKEAAFSRWQLDKNNNIIKHCYSSKWDQTPEQKDIVTSWVIDEFNALNDINRYAVLKKKESARLIYPIYMPCPGKPYYSRPSWYSLFESGWYDLNISIPALKKSILANQLGVKFIIYISPKYFERLAEERGIIDTDSDKMKALYQEEVGKMNEFLAGGNNLSKSMTSFMEYIPGSNSAEKYITIEPINNKLSGGEFITDSETSANVICYAMGIHQGLIGAAPGKSSGSISGTDKRELYLMKQAQMKPLIDRCLRIFSIIKEFNKWDKDIYIEIPEYIFTTLDQNKSGKEESTTKEV